MTDQQAKSLADAFEHEFGGEVEFENVSRPGRFRFAIRSARFDGVPHLARQDALWVVVDRVLPREATLDVSMILAFAPRDLEEVDV